MRNTSQLARCVQDVEANTKKNYAILAPTGITAIKAKGQTVHSFFKFPPRFISKKDVKFLYDKEYLQ